MIGSLCSGYEGLGMAVQAVLGGDLAWVADNDPGAAAILAHRFPLVPNLGDITAVIWDAVELVDILTGGFPCQDVSCAGARKGLRAGTRTGVWSHIATAIGVLRPRLVFLENVRGLLSAGADSDMEPCPWCLGDSGDEHALRALGAVLGDLADLGFDAEWQVVSAADAGAPHRRERVFILAWPAADAGRRELQRRGVAGVLGSAAASEPCEGDQRERPGDAARDRGAAAEDADRAASGERRLAASGQTESGRPRADASRPGGAHATADAAGARQARRQDPGAGDSDARPGSWGVEPQRGGEAQTAADADRERITRDGSPERREPAAARGRADAAADWGPYAAAIARWEAVTGRPAPRPTEPGRTGERLSPRFVEWLMGLPGGHVTAVPGLSRNAQLKALGNGVVPQQAALALAQLLGAKQENH